MTFVCGSGSDNGISMFCGERGASSLIFAVLVMSFCYFLYKRLRDQTIQTSPRNNDHNNDEEREKFIHATVPPFDQLSAPRSAPMGFMKV